MNHPTRVQRARRRVLWWIGTAALLGVLGSSDPARATGFCADVNALLGQGVDPFDLSDVTGISLEQIHHCVQLAAQPRVFVPMRRSRGTGAAGPTPFGAAGPTPFGAAGPAPLGAAGPAPRGAAGPAPLGAAGPTPFGAAGPAPFGAAGPGPRIR